MTHYLMPMLATDDVYWPTDVPKSDHTETWPQQAHYVGLPGWRGWGHKSTGYVTEEMRQWLQIYSEGKHIVMAESIGGDTISMGIGFEKEEDALAFKLAWVS